MTNILGWFGVVFGLVMITLIGVALFGVTAFAINYP
jgi:hypothetical protein